jgi:RNA polymerase sigma-70 factor (sigma-E family)
VADRGEAFDEFVAAALPELLRYGYVLTGDRHDAEDLVQSALVKTLAAWPRLIRQDAPTAYVRKVMATTRISHWRRWGSRVVLQDPPDQAIGDPMAVVDTRAALVSGLASLSARQRTVVVLRYYDDLPEAEIATLLGCPVGTVKSLLSRALAGLRSDAAATKNRKVAP